MGKYFVCKVTFQLPDTHFSGEIRIYENEDIEDQSTTNFYQKTLKMLTVLEKNEKQYLWRLFKIRQLQAFGLFLEPKARTKKGR